MNGREHTHTHAPTLSKIIIPLLGLPIFYFIFFVASNMTYMTWWTLRHGKSFSRHNWKWVIYPLWETGHLYSPKKKKKASLSCEKFKGLLVILLRCYWHPVLKPFIIDKCVHYTDSTSLLHTDLLISSICIIILIQTISNWKGNTQSRLNWGKYCCFAVIYTKPCNIFHIESSCVFFCQEWTLV